VVVIDETLFEAEEKMEKAVAVTREDLNTVRTGRANPSMFSRIVVDYYGSPTPLNQLASVSVPEARMAVVKPYDASQLKAMEKAIRDSDLGVNPTNDGSMIRIVFPQLSQERRKDLIKVAKTKAEDAKIAIRNIEAVFDPDTVVIGASGVPLTGADIVRHKDVYWALFKQFFILFNKGFGPVDVVEFNKGKEFVGVVPVVADRPLKGLIEEMGDPSQFLEYAYRSLQQATIPH